MNQRWVIILTVLLFTLAADQGTKYWARQSLRGRPALTVIPSYLDLEYHENPGSAFGLLRNLPGARYVLIGVGAVALALVWRMVRNLPQRRRLGEVAFALVAGGALGNVIDRVHIGRVVDFIVMHYQRKLSWPAYNVADAALVVGVGLLMLALGRRPEPARTATQHRGKRKK